MAAFKIYNMRSVTQKMLAMLMAAVVLITTGLQHGGIAALTKSCFELDAHDPVIVVKAGAKNKYKNECRVPLKGATASLLKVHLESKMPEAAAFRVPPKQHFAKIVRADLDAARTAWLDESPTLKIREEREKLNLLKYKDSSRRFLDFHAFRHTRGAWLFEHHKAHPREVQELMGVSSMSLVDRYTRSFRLTDLSVIECGPDLSTTQPVNTVSKTGTNDATTPKTLPPEAGFRQTSPDVGGFSGEFDGSKAVPPEPSKSNGKPRV